MPASNPPGGTSFPHRIFQLSSKQIEGVPSSDPHQSLRAAYELLESQHSHPCSSKTKLLFKRMPPAGISHDINSIVRSLAVAIRDGRQLVILPPTAKTRAILQPVAGMLSERRPWHWLPEGVPLSSVLHLSNCQRRLRRSSPGALNIMGNATDAVEAALLLFPNRSKAHMKDHDVHNKWFVEINTVAIPKEFRKNGLLWWFQVLTTFLVRINGPLARSIGLHASMHPFVERVEALSQRNFTAARRYSQLLGVTPVISGFSWRVSAAFHVGLHVRMGDVCGSKASEHGLRLCLRSLPSNLFKLAARNITGGRLFLASDSQAIIDQATLPLTTPIPTPPLWI